MQKCDFICMAAKPMLSKSARGSVETPVGYRNPGGSRKDVQGIDKGCTRVVQGILKGTKPSQRLLNTEAAPEQYRASAPVAHPSHLRGQIAAIACPARRDARRTGGSRRRAC